MARCQFKGGLPVKSAELVPVGNAGPFQAGRMEGLGAAQNGGAFGIGDGPLVTDFDDGAVFFIQNRFGRHGFGARMAEERRQFHGLGLADTLEA